MVKILLILLIGLALPSFAEEGDRKSKREELSNKILSAYGEALEDAQKQKTAGLLRTAAAKTRAEKAQSGANALKATMDQISQNLDQADQLIERMEKELQKAGVS